MQLSHDVYEFTTLPCPGSKKCSHACDIEYNVYSLDKAFDVGRECAYCSFARKAAEGEGVGQGVLNEDANGNGEPYGNRMQR